jgi:hypothetical protein
MKDNFIAENMDELEEIVNSKQSIPEELITTMFGDLDKEIELEMEQRKKDKAQKKIDDQIK